jgi:hypothetical protein
MILYSTNWMGIVSMDWYRERGLTRQVSEVLEKDQTFGDLKAGDTWTYEDITEPYACGRIDIRDSTKEGYDGWDEYDLEPMHSEDWNALSEYLWDLTTETQLSYDELIAGFEEHYGKKIRWWNDDDELRKT